MKPLLTILLALFICHPILAEEDSKMEDEILLPASPPQKVLKSYQTDFSYHHDRGFYFSSSLGPQWNHSINKPSAQGIRFGGKVNVGWFVAQGFSLFGSVWGNFLESASLIAAGPGLAYFFDGPNIGIDLSLGVGRAFNALEREGVKSFAESVLAANLSIGKFWWLSDKTSMGISLTSGIHGLTISEGKIGTIGWNAGLGLAFLFG
jgi:hypothetical protein